MELELFADSFQAAGVDLEEHLNSDNTVAGYHYDLNLMVSPSMSTCRIQALPALTATSLSLVQDPNVCILIVLSAPTEAVCSPRSNQCIKDSSLQNHT